MRLQILKDLVICAAFAWFVWAPLGRWILVRAGGNKLPDPQSLCIALGMGCWALLVFFIGLAGALYSPVMLGVAVALFVLLRLHRHFTPTNPGWSVPSQALSTVNLFTTAFGILSAIYLLLVLASGMAPEIAFDALNVHLPYARDVAESHRVAFAPNNWSSVMPALPLMSYVTAFLFSGQNLAKLMNTLCYLTCGGLIYFFVKRRWSSLHAIAAATLFWSSPVALYEATTALIDLPLTLYSAAAVFFLLEWTDRGERPFLWLSAVSLGLALGCKYHAAFWIPPFCLILLWHSLKVRREQVREVLPVAMGYTLIVSALFLPWVVRAWYYTDNPLFPMANGLFKSRYFTPAMESAARAAYANEGVGHSWAALLQIPWTVSFHPGPFRGTVGAIFLLGMALVLVRRKTTQVRYGIMLVVAYFYSWALTAQEIRYLLPLVPLLAMLTAAGVLGRAPALAGGEPDWETENPTIVSRAMTYAGLLVLLAAAVASFPSIYPRWVKEWTYWHGYKSPFPYLAGRESVQDYLRRDVPSIYVYDFINEKLTSRDRILLLNDASQFYSRVPTLYSFTFEGDELLLQETEESVLRKLRESRITHVLLNYNNLVPLPRVAPRPGVYFFLDRSFQERHLETVFSSNNVVLYRVRPS